MKKAICNLAVTGGLFVAFFILLLLVLFVDVQTSGPRDSLVGLAAINKNFANLFPFNDSWYKATEIMGLAMTILTVCFFFGRAIYQGIKRKGLAEIDFQYFSFVAALILFGVFYLIFDNFAVNYRPVIVDGQLEASFPSTHVMIAVFFGTMMIIDLQRTIKSRLLCLNLQAIIAVVALIVILGRVISGVHWLTDLLGGALLGAFLVMLYVSANMLAKLKSKEKNN